MPLTPRLRGANMGFFAKVPSITHPKRHTAELSVYYNNIMINL